MSADGSTIDTVTVADVSLDKVQRLLDMLVATVESKMLKLAIILRNKKILAIFVLLKLGFILVTTENIDCQGNTS
jgi:hypothetical protein